MPPFKVAEWRVFAARSRRILSEESASGAFFSFLSLHSGERSCKYESTAFSRAKCAKWGGKIFSAFLLFLSQKRRLSEERHISSFAGPRRGKKRAYYHAFSKGIKAEKASIYMLDGEVSPSCPRTSRRRSCPSRSRRKVLEGQFQSRMIKWNFQLIPELSWDDSI